MPHVIDPAVFYLDTLLVPVTSIPVEAERRAS